MSFNAAVFETRLAGSGRSIPAVDQTITTVVCILVGVILVAAAFYEPAFGDGFGVLLVPTVFLVTAMGFLLGKWMRASLPDFLLRSP